MDKNELLEKLKTYGADIKGIYERFVGDMDLYEQCYTLFLAEPSFTLLGQYMQQGDYVKAFDAAHALKGTSSNLGLTPFYKTIYTLVESLRAESYDNVQAEYEQVAAAFRKLAELAGAEVPQPEPAEREFSGQDRELLLRLLGENNAVAFALLGIDGQTPSCHSANFAAVTGLSSVKLTQENGQYLLFTGDQRCSINESLSRWNGKGEYTSPPLSGPGGYYTLRLSYAQNDRFLLIAQDVTRMYSDELSAQRGNEAKTNFLASLSHGIRTPMNAIVNMTRSAMDSIGWPEKQMEYLQILQQASDHLLRLLNDVLDMRRIEAGRLIPDAAPFFLKQELEKAYDIVRAQSEVKHQTFLTDFTGLKTQQVVGDAVKTTQIFLNLLTNAVDYTPVKGAIRFTAKELPGSPEGTVRVRFTVEDNGRGMEAGTIKRIFEPFLRVDGQAENSLSGTGLGLPICKSYVASLGGSISCESEPDSGTTFTVELPFRTSTAKPKHAKAPKWYYDMPFAGMTCLLCEDNRINRIVGQTMLENVGFTVDVVDDGLEGIEKFLSSKADFYDIIFMDIQMPFVDGCQSTLQIRNSAHPQAKTIPIIAISADAFMEDLERAHRAGMNGYISKPVVIRELIEEVSRVLDWKL